MSDLPRHADLKVALHLLDQRGAPSSKEGIGPSSSLMQQFGNSGLASRGLRLEHLPPLFGDATSSSAAQNFQRVSNDVDERLGLCES